MYPTKHCSRWVLLCLCGGLLLLVSCSPAAAGRVDSQTQKMDLPPADSFETPPAGNAETPLNAHPAETTGLLRVNLQDAVLLCLKNNRSLVVERMNPEIQKTGELQEKAVFDPTLNAEIAAGRTKEKRPSGSASEMENITTDSIEGGIALQTYFPTGTTLDLEVGTGMNEISYYEEAFYITRLGLSVNQALLQGLGTTVNRVRLRQARLDSRFSAYELRAYTEFLIADVEQTYWDYALAKRRIEIVEESLKVARQQLAETQTLIEVGRLAKAERAAVQAEVAAQEQALIEARAARQSIRLQLLRLLNPGGRNMWQREIELVHQPTIPDIQLEDVALHVAVSQRMRPVLNQARLLIQRNELEIVKTGNGLLPLMDLFITLGKSGYAESFGKSLAALEEDSYDAAAGLRFDYPLRNRDAKARHRRAVLSRDQARQSLENLRQLVEVDVRTAYINVNRTRQQIAASTVTRRFDEEKLRTETEKLRVGKSTSFLVAQAQRDLLASRIAEVAAIVNYLKALTDLYQLDGSLLTRRGIDAPGDEPVEMPAK